VDLFFIDILMFFMDNPRQRSGKCFSADD